MLDSKMEIVQWVKIIYIYGIYRKILVLTYKKKCYADLRECTLLDNLDFVLERGPLLNLSRTTSGLLATVWEPMIKTKRVDSH